MYVCIYIYSYIEIHIKTIYIYICIYIYTNRKLGFSTKCGDNFLFVNEERSAHQEHVKGVAKGTTPAAVRF